MLRTIEYKKGISLKEIDPDLRACENGVVSIFTLDEWKIPEENDFIKEVNPGHWNIVGRKEIRSLAYNLNNLLDKSTCIELIKSYYLDEFGLPAIRLAIAEMSKNFISSDYTNNYKMKNFGELISWFLKEFYN